MPEKSDGKLSRGGLELESWVTQPVSDFTFGGEPTKKSVTQRMGDATMQWISENPDEWRAIERRCLGLDEFGRTSSEAMVDRSLGLEALDRTASDFNECRHDRAMQFGQQAGWWEGVGASGDPIAPAVIVKISALEEHETLMAHVVTKHGFFKSVSDARKNGWDRPIELGEVWLRKKTVCLRLVP